MAGEAELMTREARVGRRLPRIVVLVAVLVVLVLQLRPHRSGAPPVGTLVVTSFTGSGAPTTQTFPLDSEAAQLLGHDLAVLQPGRISCGSPGPSGYRIQLATQTYDVNGECARVVHLGSTTAMVESSALRDELVTLSRR